MKLNEYTVSLLREQVLEHRAKLRASYAVMDIKKASYEAAKKDVLVWAERIADIQKACGDKIEIDPQYPEIVL